MKRLDVCVQWWAVTVAILCIAGCSKEDFLCGSEADAKALLFRFREPTPTIDRRALRDDQLRRVRIVVLSKANQTPVDTLDLRDDLVTGRLREIKLDDLLIGGSTYPLADYAYRVETDFSPQRVLLNPLPDTTTRVDYAVGPPQRSYRIDDIRITTSIDARSNSSCTVNTIRQFRVDGVRYDWSSMTNAFLLPPIP
jgi:hypothetical protein